MPVNSLKPMWNFGNGELKVKIIKLYTVSIALNDW